MSDFFPPDVSLRLRGDAALARTHLGEARRMLFKGLNMDMRPVRLVQFFDDGSTAHLLLSGNQKIVTIVAPPPVPPGEGPPAPREEEEKKYPKRSVMLSGWMRAPYTDFRPSPATQIAYDYEDLWQQAGKLLPHSAVLPSLYTGAMKRVVQAINGVGWHIDESPNYLTGDVDSDPKFAAVTYSAGSTVCHGIYKAGTKNHWVVRISRTQGVHAMPLILLPGTMTVGFYNRMVISGDTDTLKVLDEFGGIPSGLDIPTDEVALAAAVTQGRVLELLEAADVEPFWQEGLQTKIPLGQGFAFSETTGRAVNTCAYAETGHVQQAYAGTPEQIISITGRSQLYSELWQATLALSTHDIGAPDDAPPSPCGTGTAALARLHRGKVSPWAVFGMYSASSIPGIACLFTIPVSTYTYLDGVSAPAVECPYILPWEEFGGPVDPFGNWDNAGWGGYLYAFFDGDRLMRAKTWPHVVARPGQTGERSPNNTPVFHCDGITPLGGQSVHDHLILPPGVREAYFISFEPMDGSGYGRMRGFITGVGTVNLPVPRNGGHMRFLDKDASLALAFAATVSARGTQYFMDSSWWSTSMSNPGLGRFNNYPRPAPIKLGVPAPIGNATLASAAAVAAGTQAPDWPSGLKVGEMTWVGAPD